MAFRSGGVARDFANCVLLDDRVAIAGSTCHLRVLGVGLAAYNIGQPFEFKLYMVLPHMMPETMAAAARPALISCGQERDRCASESMTLDLVLGRSFIDGLLLSKNVHFPLSSAEVRRRLEAAEVRVEVGNAGMALAGASGGGPNAFGERA